MKIRENNNRINFLRSQKPLSRHGNSGAIVPRFGQKFFGHVYLGNNQNSLKSIAIPCAPVHFSCISMNSHSQNQFPSVLKSNFLAMAIRSHCSYDLPKVLRLPCLSGKQPKLIKVDRNPNQFPSFLKSHSLAMVIPEALFPVLPKSSSPPCLSGKQPKLIKVDRNPVLTCAFFFVFYEQPLSQASDA
ncbi:hypothetical protein CEXT_322701 [Caerostris extrusa]|uniref:Uncharacterized protein n=1 Tax=Caerostris extrusa TaxID=172846 RepID=A0AAV4VUB5_CAEEX|nr:hypothetical protein CEXT_322701 [Caerostris extrusa]